MFYDNKNDATSSRNRKKTLDSIGVEIGKEMGYYEWAVSYENRYKTSSRDCREIGRASCRERV